MMCLLELLSLRQQKNLNLCKKCKERVKKKCVEARIPTLADGKTKQGCPKSDFYCTTYEGLWDVLKGSPTCIQTARERDHDPTRKLSAKPV